jgi:Ca2+-transporting ATPase
VINQEMMIGILVQAAVMTAAVLLAFVYGLNQYPGSLEAAQTMAFSSLVMSELLRAYTARSEHYSVFSVGLFSNKWMQWAVGSSFVLLLLVIYLPFLQPFFGTVALTFNDWLVMLPLMFLAPIAAEVTKIYLRRKFHRNVPAAATG